jgi:hypothetical protein
MDAKPSKRASDATFTPFSPPPKAAATGADAARAKRTPLALPSLRYVTWGFIAAMLLQAGGLGWLFPPTPVPFEDPPLPARLAWWIRAPVDPAIAELDMVPVGRFGSFLPRKIARNVRANTAFGIDDIADARVSQEGREIAVTLDPASSHAKPATFFYSADAGGTWSTRPDSNEEVCTGRGQALKIQSFGPGGQKAELECFPKQIPDSRAAAKATTGVPFGAEATVWLQEKSGPKDTPIVITSPRGFATLGQAGTGPYTIVQPVAHDRAVVASGKEFAFVTLGVGEAGAQIAQSATPGSRPGNVASIALGPFGASLSAATGIGSAPTDALEINAIRITADGTTIVAAQEPTRRAGVLVSHDSGKNWQRLAYVTGPPPWVVFIAFPLAFLAAAAAARGFIRTPAREASIADEAATDRPIGLNDVDALQFGHIAAGLLMFIRNPQTEPPVTIGVSGAWGSGKTSLMTILRDLLRGHDARPVWFNAWHHQKEEHLLAALIENIRRQAIPSITTWAGLSFRWRLLRRRVTGRLGVLIVLLAAAIIATYVFVPEQRILQVQAFLARGQALLAEAYRATTKQAGQDAAPAGQKDHPNDRKDEKDWILAAIAVLPSGLGIPVLLFAILRNLQAFPRAKPEQLLARAKPKADIADKLSFRYRFEREFRETAAALRGGPSPGLVVFIDDLDRCQAKNVVELLEAINFIVSAGECFVIVGMDKAQVRRSILANYKSEFMDIPKEEVRDNDIEGARRRFAERYLQKLINIEVPVPQPTDQQIEVLLTGTAVRPQLPPGVELRRQLRFAYDNGPAILVAGFVVAMLIWISPYLTVPASTTGLPPPPIVEAAGSVPAAFAVPYASDEDIAAARPRAGFPWSDVALILGVLAAAGAYVTRAWVLAKLRPVSDSIPFRDALKLWTPIVFRASPTPRGVKQYKNMLRYQAMRLRARAPASGDKPIAEPDLVALGAISLADRHLLPKALTTREPINTVLKEAAATATADQQIILRQISAVLDYGNQGPPGRPSGRLTESIEEYVALLPPTA